MVMIGEFEIDPESIEEAPLPTAKENLVLEVTKAERKVAPNSGNNYISLTLTSVEHPGSVIFQSYFLTAKSLSQRSSVISWKKFLEKSGLPYTTTVAELVGFRFVGELKHVGSGDEARAELASVVGPVEN